MDRSPRSEGVRTSYLARVGFRDDIFEKSFLGVFHVRFLTCGGRPDLRFGGNPENPPKSEFFVAPGQFFHQIDGKNSKFVNSLLHHLNLPMNPTRAKYEVNRCTDGVSNPTELALDELRRFPKKNNGILHKSTNFGSKSTNFGSIRLASPSVHRSTSYLARVGFRGKLRCARKEFTKFDFFPSIW